MTTNSRTGAACIALFCLVAFAPQSALAAWHGTPGRPGMAKLFRSNLPAHARRPGGGVPPPRVHDPRLSPKQIKVPRNYPHDPRYGPH